MVMASLVSAASLDEAITRSALNFAIAVSYLFIVCLCVVVRTRSARKDNGLASVLLFCLTVLIIGYINGPCTNQMPDASPVALAFATDPAHSCVAMRAMHFFGIFVIVVLTGSFALTELEGNTCAQALLRDAAEAGGLSYPASVFFRHRIIQNWLRPSRYQSSRHGFIPILLGPSSSWSTHTQLQGHAAVLE